MLIELDPRSMRSAIQWPLEALEDPVDQLVLLVL